MATYFSVIRAFVALLLPLLPLFSILAHSSFSDAAFCHENERVALSEFRTSLIHPNETSQGIKFLESWKGLNCCKWEGIECHKTTSHVRSIELVYVRWPAELGIGYLNATSLTLLPQLQYWHLTFNNLGDVLPFKELSKLRNLKELDLSNNKFEGKIPEEVSMLSSLHVLELGYNWLQGSIPTTMGKLSRLKVLNLVGNTLNGSIPPSLGNLSFLETLDLYGNKLERAIPSSLGKLTRLRMLYLGSNQLVGSIPPTLGNLSALQELYLCNNLLRGFISPELGNLRSLVTLSLFQNDLSGDFSFIILANLSNLKAVDISNNIKLVILPSDEAPLFQLSTLILSSCDMSKFDISIPTFLSSETQLEFVDFSNSNIVGRSPTWLLQSTKILILHQNHIMGPLFLPKIPSRLEYLDISNNHISGELPINFSSYFPNLTVCLISQNFLRGNVANYINNLKQLVMLDLSTNNISGSLPSSTYNFKILDLSNNKLIGMLPSNLTGGYQLKYLSLSNNYLEGPLASKYLNLSSLESLHPSGNRFSGTIPENLLLSSQSLKVLDIADNNMLGAIPTEINRLVNLQVLNLRGNHFKSDIPFSLCQLQVLVVLDLSQNNLRGPIPPCFYNISSLSSVVPTLGVNSVIDVDLSDLNGPASFAQEEEVTFAKGRVYSFTRDVLSHDRARFVWKRFEWSNSIRNGAVEPC
ncbi:hypothetical protein AMTRI_Chr11g96010 [Amborella trichopoda]|uniref:MDIS1-interacting receptor like kinase 2 n=1 Tax=Amborella trichopoda TaxID=13333 RepID=UPI0009BD78A2|nr:MDIS1-interacting receptor like kinase 2 [Amborella trichopoda]|eukprot:XP_020518408.1 MDIS1-interacting receptor like kinase 2 [Amborella trichopoda]